MIDILLVEDDKEICFIFTELLKRNHYNVSACHNGIEAIEALSYKKYDLMLLDLMLPDLPGEKILFHLKKHNNSIPVIVISAKNQPVRCHGISEKIAVVMAVMDHFRKIK